MNNSMKKRSKRDAVKRINSMVNSVREIEKRNAYICKECRTVTLIVHIVEGVTPMFIGCTKTGCSGMAISFMYRIPPPLLVSLSGDLLPSHEWYKPSDTEASTLSEGEQDHVKKGGLIMRERTDAKPFMVKI